MKRFYTTYLVSAFSDRAFMGNSTGVVIDDGRLTDLEMENIAKDINQSVIVFVRELDRDRYLTRFFTPDGEINLCGHATVATFYALAENEYIKSEDQGIKKIIQHTKIGKIPVELEYKNGKIKNIYMNLDIKLEEKFHDIDKILKALNLSEDDIGLEICENAQMEKISTGTCDIIVPVKNQEVLSSIVLNKEDAIKISREENIISIHAFTTEDGKEIKQRTFSPIIGEDEEFGSGTSTAATMHYLSSNKISESKTIIATQGDYIGRISKVFTSLTDVENRIRVGGRSYVFMNGVLNI
ncbi:MAG: PhzF family phenazine biosynthesis protein [Peptoniphilus harei]|nr:PhzF family phenazine biosynthesis protein [Peptoniphilus harei]